MSFLSRKIKVSQFVSCVQPAEQVRALSSARGVYKHIATALILASICFLPTIASAQPITQSVRLPNQEYTETRQDIAVKVLGGQVAIRRTWAAGHWYLNPAWADLRLIPDPLGGVLAVQRASSVYEKTGSKAAQGVGGIYRFDSNNLIAQTASGWRWYDQLGNTIVYNAQGQIQSYSDPAGVTVSFVRNAQGQLSAITDHHGNTVLTLEADTEGRITRIADTAGRSVSYQWQGTGADSQLSQVTDLLGHIWKYEYDGQGQITQRTNPAGATLKITYSTSPSPIPDSPGFAGMGAGNSNSTNKLNPKEAAASIAFTGSTKVPLPPIARVASLQDESGATTLYRVEYDRTRQQYAIHTQDPVGANQIRIYNKDGLLLNDTQDGQVQSQRIVDSATQERLIDARGQTTTIYYDSARRPLKTIYPDGSSETTQYNAQGRKVRYTNPLGIISTWAYDAQGNETLYTQALGLPEQTTTRHTYDQWGQRTSTTHGAGNADGADAQTTTYQYDATGNRTQTTNPLGQNTRATYNSAGQVLSITDPLGNTTTTTYDKAGNTLSTANPLGQSVVNTYNNLGQKVKSTNPLGNVITFEYDSLGRVIQLRQPGQTTGTRITYDGAGRITQTTTPSGLTTTQTYDAIGRITQKIDPAGNATQYQYGAEGDPLAGLLISAIYPTYTENYRYDQRGRITLTTQTPVTPATLSAASQTQNAWDAAGQRISTTDAAGNTTLYHYDALGRLVKTTDSLNNTTTQTWDAHGQITSVTDAKGNTHRFEYDKAGQLTKETRPSGAATTYQYNAAGQLTQRTDAAGNTRQYQYDAAGRLTQEQYLLAGTQEIDQTITYQYNPAGQLVAYQQKDGSGQTISSATYTLDPLGRSTAAAQQYGAADPSVQSISFNLGHSYNLDEQLSGHTYPDGSKTSYSYNLGQLSQIQLPNTSNITYSNYQWMQPTKVQTPGATNILSFDALMRPLGITVQSTTPNTANQTLMSRAYQYDAAGNITQIASELGQTQYAYDALQRLTQASPDAALQTLGLPQEQYSYDGVHNRTSSAHQAGAWIYNQDNQLVQYPELKNSQGTPSQTLPTQVTYTPTGHTAGEANSLGSKTYRYNAAERLIEVSQTAQGGTANTTTTYRYDPFGRRISKTHTQGGATSTTYYVYNETGLMAELSDQGQMTKAYGFNPIAAQAGLWSTDPLWQAEVNNNSLKDPSTQTHYLHTDHLGTPVLATDKTGQTTWKGISEAFGLTRVDNGSQIEMNLRFPGQYWDQETGSHYNFNRDYRPQIGRYAQSDPIGLNGGINTYAYVGGNPLMFTDPTGEYGVGGAIGGAAFNAGAQFFTNLALSGDWRKSLRCINIADVIISGAVGFVGPGLLGNVIRGRTGPYGFSRGVDATFWATRSLPAGFAIKKAVPDFRVGSDCECAGLSIGGLVGEIIH